MSKFFPQPPRIVHCTRITKTLREPLLQRLIFASSFFGQSPPTSFMPHFSIVLWLIGTHKNSRITNTSIKVYFWIVTAFTVATRIVSSCLDYFKMNDTLFTFYDDASDETRIDKTLQKIQVLVERLGMIFRVSFC